MAEKYCLLLLLSPTGYPSTALEEKLLNNPILLGNFYFLRMNDPENMIYELYSAHSDDLPMLIFGDQVILKGDEAVMELLDGQAAMGGLPEEELQADFAQEMMAKILPAIRSFETDDSDQEFYDKTTNIFEKILILILGAMLQNLPHINEFLSENDIDPWPEFPIEMDLIEELDAPTGVIDLEFDETFLSSFWQFCMTPPAESPNKWMQLFYELSEIGLPIKALLKSLAWYLGRYAARDLKIAQQI
ncbi:MAG: hypothetical protein ACXAC7_15620, partial [Candidatus Hodarchaeales archaeon]